MDKSHTGPLVGGRGFLLVPAQDPDVWKSIVADQRI